MNSEIFILPKKQAADIEKVIKNLINQELPLNVGLFFEKYPNKFVTGYLSNEGWKQGKQSEIKRQIYLLTKSRLSALENLRKLKKERGNMIRIIKKGRNVIRKPLREDIDLIISDLEKVDFDEAIKRASDVIRDVKKSKEEAEKVLGALEKILDTLAKTKLTIPYKIFSLEYYTLYYRRFDSILNKLEDVGYKVRSDILSPKWRLSINLGAPSIYETSLLFHRNHSLSIIPGSALKGVAHHYAKYQRKLLKEDIAKIFGTQDKKGEVIFFDALPVIDQNRDFVVLDVMNVHYRDYYQKGKTPGDWMNPNPVFFLTIERLKFRFVVASKDESLSITALDLLKNAINKVGIGAKTSTGYGYFE